jgi:hypothetical protein
LLSVFLPPSPSVVLDRAIAALFSRHPVVTRRAETASAGSVSAASRTGSAVRPRRPILALSALQSIAFRPTGPEQPSPKAYRLLIHPGITRLFLAFQLLQLVCSPPLSSTPALLSFDLARREQTKAPAGEARRGVGPDQNGMSSTSSRSASAFFLPRPLAGAGSAGASAAGALVRKSTLSA